MKSVVQKLVLLIGLLLLTGCQSISLQTESRSLLEEASGPNVKYSDYVPDHPYQQYAPGLLYRKTFISEDMTNVNIEIWDLLIGPAQAAHDFSLPTAAIHFIRTTHFILIISSTM